MKQRIQKIREVTVLNGILSLSVIYPELIKIITPSKIANNPPTIPESKPPTLEIGLPMIPKTPSTMQRTPAIKAKTFLMSLLPFAIKPLGDKP